MGLLTVRLADDLHDRLRREVEPRRISEWVRDLILAALGPDTSTEPFPGQDPLPLEPHPATPTRHLHTATRTGEVHWVQGSKQFHVVCRDCGADLGYRKP